MGTLFDLPADPLVLVGGLRPGTQWVVILLLVLLLFGARKLPELANSVGRSLREFRKGAQGAFEDDEVEDDEAPAPDRDAER